MKLLLVCLFVVLVSLRAQGAERPLDLRAHLRLAPPPYPQTRLHLVPMLEGGGGEDPGSDSTRTAGRVLLGSGLGGTLLGGWLVYRGLPHGEDDKRVTGGGTLLGIGVLAAATGIVLLWRSGSGAHSTGGLFDSGLLGRLFQRPVAPLVPLREALAGIDPKRASDKGRKLPMLKFRF